MNETIERLTHTVLALEEIINLQREIIDEVFKLLLMHISASAEELTPVIGKISEAAIKKAELED